MTAIFKALCYPGKAKNVSLDSLVRLAHVDGKRVMKGTNVKVLDRLWSDVCSFWVVIVGSELPTVENTSAVEAEKRPE